MSACVTISEKNVQMAIEIVSRFDIAEVRLDLCEYDTEEMRVIFSSHTNLIATCRPNRLNRMSQKDCLKTAIEVGAAWIDIEYDMEKVNQKALLELANERGVKTIVSYHNFERTEGMEELKAIVENSFKMGAVYVKLATTVIKKEDAIRILQLYAEYSNLIAFGMGEKAKFTRITSLFLGAPFTYVYAGRMSNQLAEGQLSEKEYIELMKILEPSSHQ